MMRTEWIEKIYAGWLGKIIGIRLGGNVEGWTYEKIKEVYGAPEYYTQDYKHFAADDDSNGPIAFIRALEDAERDADSLEAEDVAEALLNYAPYEHGFFWWGSYGISTEHTSYLNLRAGIPAPMSGSVELNGSTLAEQIGGQIFIDSWGLVAPGRPEVAAKMAEKAASVTHGGNGVYGGMFLAACISYAFVEKDIHKIIEKGLSFIPEDCEYTLMVRRVMEFHKEHPEDWEVCFDWLNKNYNQSSFPGVVHILPNIAVMILALLYGNGDFSDTLNICNRCGWDTDCNVGNVGTIMGVRGGLEVIEERWRKPINDFLACSTVLGSFNIQDVPYGAVYMAKLAYRLAGEEMPEPWKTITEKRIHGCHFEFPGSTHTMEAECLSDENVSVRIENTDEAAFTGERSLKVSAEMIEKAEQISVSMQTYYGKDDFNDSRYDPDFSPVLYPGETIVGSAMMPAGVAGTVCLFARNARTGEVYTSDSAVLADGKWATIEYKVPALEGVLLDRAGFLFESASEEFVAYVDDFYVCGKADYSVEFANEIEESWTFHHKAVSQFTRLKGIFTLRDGQAHLSCADYGEAYTGRYNWEDYEAIFEITPTAGEKHYGCVRVQGGVRCYYVGLHGQELAILKNTRRGVEKLAAVEFAWELGKTYEIHAVTEKNVIKVFVGDVHVSVCDTEKPYLEGAIGLAVKQGSHLTCKRIEVK